MTEGNASMHVAELWRYPVKSMAGERLERAWLGPLGVEGDRVVHVEDAGGGFITSRTHPRLLGHHATLDSSGEPKVDNLPWTEPRISQQIIDIGGPGAHLVRDETEHRFDILPLLVATDGAIQAFGHDGRRLRANIVIGGVQGLAERTWEGQCLRIGEVVIGIERLRMRCLMTTFDPDSLQQDRGVLKEIVQKFEGKLALNCFVIKGGEIRMGDAVQLWQACEHEKTVSLR